MMSKLAQNYPMIRKLIYAAVVVICGGLVFAGILTEAESATYLAYIGSGLGAFAAILASLNVNPTVVDLEPSEYKIGPPYAVNVDELAAKLGKRLDLGVQQVQSHAAVTVAELRARAEEELGHRL